MKKIFLFAALFLLGSLIEAQSSFNNFTYKGTSLDVVTNPASIVMGESFVANPNNSSSFIENPANLYSSKEFSLFYNYRTHDWMELTKNYNYSSIGGSMQSSWGFIGFSLNQFSTGANSINLYSDLTSKEVNRTYSLSISKQYYKNLFIGASLKIFNHSKSGEGDQSTIESNNAYLLDLGIRYQFVLGSSQGFQHDLNLGAVIQNLGTDYKEKDSYFSDQYYYVRLPRYFKIGFAYNLQLKNSDGKSDVEATLTGQYKSLINPQSSEATDVDYWGGGIEIIIKNIFAARAGFIQMPEYWVFYDRAKPIFRFGFGLVLPLEKLGLHIPLIISADYSFIPIKSEEMQMYFSSSNNMMHAFGFTLRYKSVFF